eukprot:jgi/Botrbrau1/22827/Bobra.0132s0150.1
MAKKPCFSGNRTIGETPLESDEASKILPELPLDLHDKLFASLDSFDLRSLRLAGRPARSATLKFLTSLTISTFNNYDESLHTDLQKSFERLTALKSIHLYTAPQHALVSLPQNPVVVKSISLVVKQRPSSADWDRISSNCQLPGLTQLVVSILRPPNYIWRVLCNPFLNFKSLQAMCPAEVAVRVVFSQGWGDRDCAAIGKWTSLVEVRGPPCQRIASHYRDSYPHYISPLVLSLPAFARLRSLECLPFDNRHALTMITSITALTCLKLCWLEEGTVPLMDISTLHGLRVLHVCKMYMFERLDLEDMKPISHLTSLCELGGSLDICSPEALKFLDRMSCLTSIVRSDVTSTIKGEVVVNAGALRPAPLTALRCLDAKLDLDVPAHAAALCSSLPSIESLSLLVPSMFAGQVRNGLQSATRLTKLVLGVYGMFYCAPRSLGFLSNLTHLEILGLSFTLLDHTGMEGRREHMRILGRFTRLTRLSLWCGEVNGMNQAMPWEVVHPLSTLRRLSCLQVSWSWRLKEHALARLNAGLREMGLPALRIEYAKEGSSFTHVWQA